MLLNKLKFWCYKVLPLVYDDSLSYYEVLSKVTGKINELINKSNMLDDGFNALESDIKEIENEVEAIDNKLVEYVFKNLLNRLVWFGITDDGHFVAYIPDSWVDIQFDTIMEGEYYGHLVLGYDDSTFNKETTNYYDVRRI